jgi:hypothetical protein
MAKGMTLSAHRSETVSRAGGLILATKHRERLADDARQRVTSSQTRRHVPR